MQIMTLASIDWHSFEIDYHGLENVRQTERVNEDPALEVVVEDFYHPSWPHLWSLNQHHVGGASVMESEKSVTSTIANNAKAVLTLRARLPYLNFGLIDLL